jgi:hypothetical protein
MLLAVTPRIYLHLNEPPFPSSIIPLRLHSITPKIFPYTAAMHTADTQQRFIQLRVEGLSFARIAEELKVSKPTLIEWSHKHHREIANLLAIRKEQAVQCHLASLDARLDQLGAQLRAAEAEFAKRDLSTLTTGQLVDYIASLKRQLRHEAGPVQFHISVDAIPEDEYADRTYTWNA